MDSVARMPIAVGVIILLVCAAGAYFLLRSVPTQDAVAPTLDSSPDVTAEVSGAVQSPAEQLPETNPFSDYTNPFE